MSFGLDGLLGALHGIELRICPVCEGRVPFEFGASFPSSLCGIRLLALINLLRNLNRDLILALPWSVRPET